MSRAVGRGMQSELGLTVTIALMMVMITFAMAPMMAPIAPPMAETMEPWVAGQCQRRVLRKICHGLLTIVCFV